jgi:hypothetical protein
VICQPALLAAYLRQRQSRAAEFGRYWQKQVARCPKFLEILVEEAVLLVIRCSA